MKLVVDEAWSEALRTAIRDAERLVVSALATTEVRRALHRAEQPDWEPLADRALSRCTVLRIEGSVLERAGAMRPPELRSLDAIHLATAERLRQRLDAFVTYDDRLGAAAAAASWTVLDPGRGSPSTGDG